MGVPGGRCARGVRPVKPRLRIVGPNDNPDEEPQAPETDAAASVPGTQIQALFAKEKPTPGHGRLWRAFALLAAVAFAVLCLAYLYALIDQREAPRFLQGGR